MLSLGVNDILCLAIPLHHSLMIWPSSSVSHPLAVDPIFCRATIITTMYLLIASWYTFIGKNAKKVYLCISLPKFRQFLHCFLHDMVNKALVLLFGV